MKKKIIDKNYFFVDESGDPTFYNRFGKCIVGNNGCSKILLIGFVMTDNPIELRKQILTLKKEVINDPYLKGVPSLDKTRKYFHASADVPEVREKVFKLLIQLNFKAEFIVARKKEGLFKKRHRSSSNVFYDDVVTKLFTNKLHLAKKSFIYYEVRGSRKGKSHSKTL